MNPHLAHDDEDDDDSNDDYADYEDICNNNSNTPPHPVTATTTTTSDIRCDFKTYGFVRKFTKAPSLASSSHNDKSNHHQQHSHIQSQSHSYNGFHDFNAIPRATTNGEDSGYPMYGEKIINDKQPIGVVAAVGSVTTGAAFREPKDADFIFTEQQQNNNQKYLNNHQPPHPQQAQQQLQQQQNSGTLSRKLLLLNNQHVNLYNNNFNQLPKIGNRSEPPDFANRPLPQTPPSAHVSPLLLARQRPAVGATVAVVAPRAVCPTPPLCRTNRKGPFIFGVDNNNHSGQRSNSNTSTSNSSPAGSPLLRSGQDQQQQRQPPVIEQWKYSENNNSNNLNSPDLIRVPSLIPNGANNVTTTTTAGALTSTTTAIRRRDVFQRTATNGAQQVRVTETNPHLFKSSSSRKGKSNCGIINIR